MTRKLEFGNWSIDAGLNQVTIGGKSFRLRPRTMDLLVYMAERPNEVVSVEDLLSAVWQDVIVSENSVYRAISELRQIFDEACDTREIIQTIPKRGYRLLVEDESASTAETSVTPPNAGTEPPARRRINWLGALAVASIAGILIATTGFIGQGSSSVSRKPTIGVLPFRDLSPDGDQQNFADGLAVQIWSELNRIDGLQLAGSASIFYFRDSTDSMHSIGAQMGVDYLLRGSFRKSGDDLRIDPEVIDVETGFPEWSDSYDGNVANIFDVQEDIALDVAGAVGVRLGVAEWSPYPGMTRNVEAYDEFLKASGTRRDDILAALEHLERAVDIDPEFGVAWTSLALTYAGIASGVLSADVASAAERAEYAGARARGLDPDLPFALQYLGVQATSEGRWAEADRYYDAARQSAANGAYRQNANVYYAEFLIRVGRMQEAIRELERARSINRLDKDVALLLTLAYGAAGDLGSALTELERSEALVPSPRHSALHGGGGLIALGSRDPEIISRWLPGENPASAEGIDPTNINRWARAFLENPAGGLAMLRRYEPALRSNPFIVASWANYFGDPELALEFFRRAPLEAQAILGVHLWLPLYAEMRKLPEFKDLVLDLGLVDYWRETNQWNDYCKPTGDGDFLCK
jgi:DNA-binding winged helix-turn-helix (wHTH) protein/TolB-like protein/tetratricopeptide (TPR) repeat protein